MSISKANSRRQFLAAAGRVAIGGTFAAGAGLPLAHASDYTGKLLLVVQAYGGWDPTSFCDPKTNTPGEPIINRWALSNDIQTAGNLQYAPWASNGAFFNKYYQRMLVINGVDAQTNSHSVGIVHNFSGRNSEGLPSLTALFAAHQAPGVTMPYLNFGGFGATQNLVRSTRLDDPDLVRQLAWPNVPDWATVNDTPRHFQDSMWARLRAAQAEATANLTMQTGLLPKAARNRSFYDSAISRTDGLVDFAMTVPPAEQLQGEEGIPGVAGISRLKRQGQIALLAFQAGVAVSADLGAGEFDTHADHDAIHEPSLATLTQAVDWIWDYAETLGLADRLVMVLGSDFGRTNFYNAVNGKDHWPIGSVIVMEKNQAWSNRMVGETDAIHNAHRINPQTLARDDSNGTIIYPKHVHKALRNYLGLADSPGAQAFSFPNTEDFNFFG